jgi:hypothetical protein
MILCPGGGSDEKKARADLENRALAKLQLSAQDSLGRLGDG